MLANIYDKYLMLSNFIMTDFQDDITDGAFEEVDQVSTDMLKYVLWLSEKGAHEEIDLNVDAAHAMLKQAQFVILEVTREMFNALKYSS